MLTHLRTLGHCFNPVSFYYCHAPDGTLRAVVAEVTSTPWAQRHAYVLEAGARPVHVGAFAKRLHVSPFMGMDVDYVFAVTTPAKSLVAHMTTSERREPDEKPYFDATLTLERRPWSASAIRWQLMRHPLMTLKVIGAIHFEALRLWLKGIPGHPHPRDGGSRRTSRQEANT